MLASFSDGMDGDEMPVPVIGEEELDDLDEADITALEDDAPTEKQRQFIQGGAILTPRHAGNESGVSVGMPLDKLEGQKVRMVDVDGVGHRTIQVAFALTGANDPVIHEILTRRATTKREFTKKNYIEEFAAAMREIASVKQRSAAKTTKPRSIQPVHQDQIMDPNGEPAAHTKAAVDVVFDFGGVDGSRRARYTDVIINQDLLILVAGDADLRAGVYEPPDLGPNYKFTVTVSGLESPIRVFSCGLNFTYRGVMFFQLFVDRDEE